MDKGEPASRFFHGRMVSKGRRKAWQRGERLPFYHMRCIHQPSLIVPKNDWTIITEKQQLEPTGVTGFSESWSLVAFSFWYFIWFSQQFSRTEKNVKGKPYFTDGLQTEEREKLIQGQEQLGSLHPLPSALWLSTGVLILGYLLEPPEKLWKVLVPGSPWRRFWWIWFDVFGLDIGISRHSSFSSNAQPRMKITTWTYLISWIIS